MTLYIKAWDRRYMAGGVLSKTPVRVSERESETVLYTVHLLYIQLYQIIPHYHSIFFSGKKAGSDSVGLEVRASTYMSSFLPTSPHRTQSAQPTKLVFPFCQYPISIRPFAIAVLRLRIIR
jgi:hypothetical protein